MLGRGGHRKWIGGLVPVAAMGSHCGVGATQFAPKSAEGCIGTGVNAKSKQASLCEIGRLGYTH